MSPAFQHDPLSDIADIKKILSEQYDVRSFAKELVQNADDAQASTLHFTWAPGWPDSPHPLLQIPALVVLNDGVFRAQDRKAIQYLRLGSKGADARAIGKFGLGLKSVFHVSDVILYFGSATQPGSEGEPFSSSLNPWEGSQHHENWLGVEDHLGGIHSWLSRWPHGHQAWFALWLPLRQRHHKPPIVPEYVEPSSFFVPELPQHLARLLPLLKHVSRICLWEGGDQPVQRRQVVVRPDSRRRLFPDLEPGSPRSLAGVIDTGVGKVVYSGLELLMDDPRFVEMQGEENWPQVPTIDESLGAVMVPEKGSPHAAAVFAARKIDGRETATVLVSPAVFLPLSDENRTHNCGGDTAYELLLHGTYFVDSGRRRLETRNEWNERLRQQGTLRLVLPALAEFAVHAGLSDVQLSNLTQTLSRALAQDLRDVCRDSMWLLRVTRNKPRGEWRLTKGKEFLTVPNPPSDMLNLPFDVFQNLSPAAEETPVTATGSPRLVSAASLEWLTPAGEWRGNLLDCDVVSVFRSAASIDYFTELVASELGRVADDARVAGSRPVADLIQRAAAELGVSRLRELANAVRRLIALLPREAVVAIPDVGEERRPEFDRLLSGLASISPERLVLPDLFGSGTDRQVVSPAGAGKILGWLAQHSTAGRHGVALTNLVALAVLQATSGSDVDKRSMCGTQELFRVRRCRDRRETAL